MNYTKYYFNIPKRKQYKIKPKTLSSDQDILKIVNLAIRLYFLNESFWDYIFGFRDDIFYLDEK